MTGGWIEVLDPPAGRPTGDLDRLETLLLDKQGTLLLDKQGMSPLPRQGTLLLHRQGTLLEKKQFSALHVKRGRQAGVLDAAADTPAPFFAAIPTAHVDPRIEARLQKSGDPPPIHIQNLETNGSFGRLRHKREGNLRHRPKRVRARGIDARPGSKRFKIRHIGGIRQYSVPLNDLSCS
jgi:hypothetical protein